MGINDWLKGYTCVQREGNVLLWDLHDAHEALLGVIQLLPAGNGIAEKFIFNPNLAHFTYDHVCYIAQCIIKKLEAHYGS